MRSFLCCSSFGRVSNLRLGVVDDSSSPESRELIATMTESKSFRLAGCYFSGGQLGDAISRSTGTLDQLLMSPAGTSEIKAA